jgi:PadR family transcriptional regulator, regulatory protein PadR
MRIPLNARTAVLLALDRPGYGLQIIERIRQHTEGRIRLRLGSVYPALRRLREQGLVRSWGAPNPKRGRRRLYYELTPKGVDAARAQREAIQGLLPVPITPPPEELARMRDRLRECAELSAFVLDLRRRTLEAQTAGA